MEDSDPTETPSWIETLATFNHTHAIPQKSEEELEKDVEEHFMDVFRKRKEKEITKDKTLQDIPRFYFKRLTGDDPLLQALRHESRSRFLNNRTQQLLDSSELDVLYKLLVKHGEIEDPLANVTDGWISYPSFKTIGEEMGPKCSDFFRTSVFLKFSRDAGGRIQWMNFFNYVMRKLSLFQTRISLSYYDAEGYGYLREQDLENYIFELIPTMPGLRTIREGFYPFYVFHAVRKFLFFLDPTRRGRITIKDFLVSPILAELFELREENIASELEESNWFSARSFDGVYQQYLILDTDKSGMLNQAELLRYGGGSLSQPFVSRVFEECHTYDGELDFKGYLEFVLAMENKKTPQALTYFFRLLDIKHEGRLTIMSVYYFFRHIRQRMSDAGHEPAKAEDIKNEVFDMVKPKDPYSITLEDLIGCGCGDTVVNILIDINGFWAYDNRELLANEDPGDSIDLS